VAYTDEGVELRKSGINLPIMVMNPEEESFDDIIKYNLEPDIYSFRILDDFVQTASLYCRNDEKISIHIELDTGMHRLGFMGDDIPELIGRLKDAKAIEVKSFFSHLACSEDSEMDSFTRSQIEKFRRWSTLLKESLGCKDVLCHILNSSGIVRFPEAEMDMVRLGIGLYGVSPMGHDASLHPISTLKTIILQIHEVPADETVGYSRRGTLGRKSRIAALPIGYADGLNRRFGNGSGYCMIAGQKAPYIGNICMDVCMVDVTEIDCKEGDEVEIFGNQLSVELLAEWIDTIPYEILTSVSNRIKRVYFSD
jgi:alanine racemase